ncbi:hypothetical protein RclHR1_03480011 [Rhizophagus clarus]|nr:hypothetical protein RclHR1_03480011 [Rhizophagus clarus]
MIQPISFSYKIIYNETPEKIPEEYRRSNLCGICHSELLPQLTENIVILTCGHLFHWNCLGPEPHCPLEQEFNTNEQSTNDNDNGNLAGFDNDNNYLNDDTHTIFIESNNQENTNRPENTGENDHNHGNINHPESDAYEPNNNNEGSSSRRHRRRRHHHSYRPRTNRSVRNEATQEQATQDEVTQDEAPIPGNEVTQEQATQDEVTQDEAPIPDHEITQEHATQDEVTQDDVLIQDTQDDVQDYASTQDIRDDASTQDTRDAPVQDDAATQYGAPTQESDEVNRNTADVTHQSRRNQEQDSLEGLINELFSSNTTIDSGDTTTSNNNDSGTSTTTENTSSGPTTLTIDSTSSGTTSSTTLNSSTVISPAADSMSSSNTTSNNNRTSDNVFPTSINISLFTTTTFFSSSISGAANNDNNNDLLKPLIKSFRKACRAEIQVINANQEEIACWYDYGEQYIECVKALIMSRKCSENTARKEVYDSIMKHLPGCNRNNLRTKTQGAIKIYKLFKKIGKNRIKCVKSYSASFILKLTSTQIQRIENHYDHM